MRTVRLKHAAGYGKHVSREQWCINWREIILRDLYSHIPLFSSIISRLYFTSVITFIMIAYYITQFINKHNFSQCIDCLFSISVNAHCRVPLSPLMTYNITFVQRGVTEHTAFEELTSHTGRVLLFWINSRKQPKKEVAPIWGVGRPLTIPRLKNLILPVLCMGINLDWDIG
jgi:hypothetical protein